MSGLWTREYQTRKGCKVSSITNKWLSKHGEGDADTTHITYRVKLFFLPATQGLESWGISTSDDPEYAGLTTWVH